MYGLVTASCIRSRRWRNKGIALGIVGSKKYKNLL